MKHNERRIGRGTWLRHARRLALGLALALAGLHHPQAAAAATSFTYELDEPGQVSAAIYDADGRLVRELLRGQWREPGEHTLAWDGLDRDGRPLEPGEYQWRLLRTNGLKAHYITSLGVNPRSGPMTDRMWVGNHRGPASVAADQSGMYVAASLTETAAVLLKQSLDGHRRHWTRSRGEVTHGRFQGGNSLAPDGDGTLYMLQQNGFIQVIDADEGTRRDMWDVLPEDDQRRPDNRLTHTRYRHGEHVSMMDMAAHGETIVVSYHDRDRLVWLDPSGAQVAAEMRITAPWGVAVGAEGRVYVISEDAVWHVEPDAEPRAVVTGELVSPRRLAVDRDTGELLVMERSPSHQIKRFSPEGELLTTYGREGGRRDGVYEPRDFRDVTAIAVDGRGGFLVAEETSGPRRVAHFNAEGRLVNEWYGGQPYYTWGEPDPRDPTKVWFNAGGWLTLAEIDYEQGAWRVLENYHASAMLDGLVRIMSHHGRWRVLYHEDQRYLVAAGGGPPQVLAHESGTLRPVSVIGHRGDVDTALALAGRGADEETQSYRSFRWIDRSGDGVPHPDEFTFSTSDAVPANDGSGTWVDHTFAYYAGGQVIDEDGTRYGTIIRTEPRWSDYGPVYPIGDEDGLNQIVARTPLAHVGGRNREHASVGNRGRGAYRDRDGNYYLAYNVNPENHGSGWPTNWAGQTRFVKFDTEGRERWAVGRHAIHGGLGSAPGTTPPGYIHVPVRAIGEVRDAIILCDRVETPAMAWTRDGLYVGSFFDRRADDGLPDTVYAWWRTRQGEEAITTSDHAATATVIETDQGEVYWFTQGRNSSPVYRISGWDDWTRQSGTLHLERTPPHASGEGVGLRAAYYDQPDFTATPVTERIDEQVWHGSGWRQPGNHNVIDVGPRGELPYEWSEGVDALDGQRSGFAVRWTGEIEAPLTETFTFSTYARGGVRLWIDGKQRIFGYNEHTQQRESEPIALQAGQRYRVQLDYRATSAHPACSLNWESDSIDRRRIPSKHLYPTEIVPSERPDVRPATRRIAVDTFDLTNIETDDVRDYTRAVRQRGIGRTGAYLGFERIRFQPDVRRLRVLANGRPAGRGTFDVTFELRLGAPDGPTLATVTMHHEHSDTVLETATLTQRMQGVHDIYLVNTTTERWHAIHFEALWFD